MALVDSLLTAVVRSDGDALVLHVGEKPYVVAAGGQVELSKQGLGLGAMEGMLAQLLSADALRALREMGAVEHELEDRPAATRRPVHRRGGARRRRHLDRTAPASAPARSGVASRSAGGGGASHTEPRADRNSRACFSLCPRCWRRLRLPLPRRSPFARPLLLPPLLVLPSRRLLRSLLFRLVRRLLLVRLPLCSACCRPDPAVAAVARPVLVRSLAQPGAAESGRGAAGPIRVGVRSLLGPVRRAVTHGRRDPCAGWLRPPWSPRGDDAAARTSPRRAPRDAPMSGASIRMAPVPMPEFAPMLPATSASGPGRSAPRPESSDEVAAAPDTAVLAAQPPADAALSDAMPAPVAPAAAAITAPASVEVATAPESAPPAVPVMTTVEPDVAADAEHPTGQTVRSEPVRCAGVRGRPGGGTTGRGRSARRAADAAGGSGPVGPSHRGGATRRLPARAGPSPCRVRPPAPRDAPTGPGP